MCALTSHLCWAPGCSFWYNRTHLPTSHRRKVNAGVFFRHIPSAVIACTYDHEKSSAVPFPRWPFFQVTARSTHEIFAFHSLNFRGETRPGFELTTWVPVGFEAAHGTAGGMTGFLCNSYMFRKHIILSIVFCLNLSAPRFIGLESKQQQGTEQFRAKCEKEKVISCKRLVVPCDVLLAELTTTTPRGRLFPVESSVLGVVPMDCVA